MSSYIEKAADITLDAFVIDVNPDRNLDPYLICVDCRALVCTVEHEDTLGTLAAVARAHSAECQGGGSE